MSDSQPSLYAGLSHVTYGDESFDLGHGVVLRSTYAHLFAPHMMAFSRTERDKPSPRPWRAARGGFSYDIELELVVPESTNLPGNQNAKDVIWLIAALLRLAAYPFLIVPVLSDIPFTSAATSRVEPLLQPFELQPRILRVSDGDVTSIKTSDLEWVKSVWPRTADLLRTNTTLNLALRAADACTIKGKLSSALLTAWGALEELFAPSRAELRFRVSAHIAAYLQPTGQTRLELFKHVADLYNARSKAAHSAQNAETQAFMESFVILRNALIKMIDAGQVPTQPDFEKLLFCGDKI